MIPSPYNLHTVRSLSKLTHKECYNTCLELGFSEKYLEGRSTFELWDIIIGVGAIDPKGLELYKKWFKKTKDYTRYRYKVGERKW